MASKLIDVRSKIASETIFEDLAKILDPHKEDTLISNTFLVDSSKNEQIKIVIKYPGKKVKPRNLKRVNASSVLWECVYDFLVSPIFKCKEIPGNELTYRKILTDFEENKKGNAIFWDAIVELYKSNIVVEKNYGPLKGLNPLLFIYTLKWLWIQEDLNYKLNHSDIDFPTRYKVASSSKALGRKKFFTALLLVEKHNYTAMECSRLFS